MKLLLTQLLVASFICIALFGPAALLAAHQSGSCMAEHLSDGALCPQENSFGFLNYHFNALRVFSQAVFSLLFLSAAVFCFFLLSAYRFRFSVTGSFPPLENLKHVSETPTHATTMFHRWLKNLVHSPTVR